MSAIAIKIRAQLVDELDSLNYSYRQGEISRDAWIGQLRQLGQIGKAVDWDLYAVGPLTEVILSELHVSSKR